VIYPASVAGKYSWLMALNPMTGVIQTARAALLGTTPINWNLVSISLVACSVLLVIGIIQFKTAERHFADTI
jgi:lipopolysaccharide transport system permease protein